MAVLIEGMEMPKRGMVVNIYADGRVTNHFDEFGETIGKAVPIPPHGRLIDENEFFQNLDKGMEIISLFSLPDDFVSIYTQLIKDVKEEIGKCHTVIPASNE